MNFFPLQPTPYLLNGVASNSLKKYEEAKNSLETGVAYVVNDAPLKGEFYSQLGETQFGLGDKNAGMKRYEEAMATDTRSALIPNNLAYRLATEKSTWTMPVKWP